MCFLLFAGCFISCFKYLILLNWPSAHSVLEGVGILCGFVLLFFSFNCVSHASVSSCFMATEWFLGLIMTLAVPSAVVWPEVCFVMLNLVLCYCSVSFLPSLYF